MPRQHALIYALVGADSFLHLQELGKIARSLGERAQRRDFDGETAQLADVLDELRSYSMFGGGSAKLVVVRDAETFVSRYREPLEEYAAAPSDSGVLAMRMSSFPKTQRIYKLIEKQGGIVDCDAPKDASRWAIDRARSAHRVTLAPDAARLLADLVGADLARLDTEIAKLAIMADEAGENDKAGGKITAELVQDNVAFTRDREIWDLTNALAVGQTNEALRRWRQLIQLDSSSEYRAVTWLGMWLEDVGVVLSGSPAAQKLRWKYKGKDYDQFVASARRLGAAGHGRALDLLAEIDRQSKSGIGDAASNVERFILALALKKNAKAVNADR